jgi:MOSC domain-containing protein YiiM
MNQIFQGEDEMPNGTVVAIYTCAKAGEPMNKILSVLAIAGEGLDGDRYRGGQGSFNKKAGQGNRQLTIMSSESFSGSGYAFAESRRNIFTRGIEPVRLIGLEFQMGSARFRGVKYCYPCDRPTELSGNSTSFKNAFFERGGLICEVICTGTFVEGNDIITPY